MWIVYYTATTKELATTKGRYDSEAWARRKCDQLNKRFGEGSFSYTTVEDYNSRVVHMKTVHNLMTGEAVEIPSNTPLCCDPSSETYWSM